MARLAQIPVRQVNRSDRKLLMTLERNLKTMVFGQDHAIKELCQAIAVKKWFDYSAKPIGGLFTGPTGVGKPRLQLSLPMRLVETLRFDMSEYMEKNGASQLVGAPPGYVGFDKVVYLLKQ